MFDSLSEEKKADYFSSLKLKVYFDIPYEDLTDEERENAAVIFYDRTPQLSWTNLSRASIQEPILNIMSECFPLMRTSLFNASGVKGMRVSSNDEVSNVIRIFDSFYINRNFLIWI